MFFIRSHSGHFWCAEDGGGRELSCNRNAAAEFETFVLSPTDKNSPNWSFGIDVGVPFTIEGALGMFVCAEDGGGGAVNVNREEAAEWETFVAHGREGKYAFQTVNGKFLRAVHGGGNLILADRDSIGPHELFSVRPLIEPDPPEIPEEIPRD